GGEEDVLESGDGSVHHSLSALAVWRKDDVADYLVLPADVARVVEFLDLDGLAISVILARFGEFSLFRGEFIDDRFDLGLAGIRRNDSEQPGGEQKGESKQTHDLNSWTD